MRARPLRLHSFETAKTAKCIVYFCASLILPFQAFAQTSTLDQAMKAFNDLKFDESIELFSEVANDASSDTESLKNAHHYLARLYVAKQMEEQARSSVRDLLELEPPMVELNKDEERLDLMNIYYSVRNELTGGYEIEKPDVGIHTIAIVDFTNGSISSDPSEYDRFSAHLASKMINFLNGSIDLKVVERERLQWILSELELQRDDNLVDQATAVRVGKLIGAQSVLFGNFSVIGRNIDIGCRLVRTETGEILTGASVDGRLNDVFDLTKDLSLDIAKAINVTLDEDIIDQVGESRNLDAMMAFEDGVRLLQEKQYTAAYNKFEEALEHDPSYALAELRLSSLRLAVN